MTFDLYYWPLTSWACKGSYILSINQVWFQSDVNFSNEVNLTYWAHFTTWPLMTFDLGIWYLTARTYKWSHIVSINQVWLQSIQTLIFQMCRISHFQMRWTFWAHLTTWPWYIIFYGMNIQRVPYCMSQVWFQSI